MLCEGARRTTDADRQPTPLLNTLSTKFQHQKLAANDVSTCNGGSDLALAIGDLDVTSSDLDAANSDITDQVNYSQRGMPNTTQNTGNTTTTVPDRDGIPTQPTKASSTLTVTQADGTLSITQATPMTILLKLNTSPSSDTHQIRHCVIHELTTSQRTKAILVLEPVVAHDNMKHDHIIATELKKLSAINTPTLEPTMEFNIVRHLFQDTSTDTGLNMYVSINQDNVKDVYRVIAHDSANARRVFDILQTTARSRDYEKRPASTEQLIELLRHCRVICMLADDSCKLADDRMDLKDKHVLKVTGSIKVIAVTGNDNFKRKPALTGSETVEQPINSDKLLILICLLDGNDLGRSDRQIEEVKTPKRSLEAVWKEFLSNARG